MVAEPFAHTSGPRDAKVVVVGEAWGEQEELTGRPFVGASGQELTRMLTDAGISRKDLLLTTTLAIRPTANNMDSLCASKKDVGFNYALAPLRQGKYLLPEYLPELARLEAELTAYPRNLVIALGATACWALLGRGAVGTLHGVVAHSVGLAPGLKVLPTYHPSAVLRNWALRVIVIADLIKAKRESEFPEIRRPQRQVLADPSLVDIEDWFNREAKDASILSCDIETANRAITCIGFASSTTSAICIPFADNRYPGGSYWPDHASEVTAWRWVKAALELPCPKLFQNGMYDLNYLYRMGFRVRNCLHDTMLLHHSIFPEMQKSLGFMGSIHTNEASWKLMRHKKKEEELKRDE